MNTHHHSSTVSPGRRCSAARHTAVFVLLACVLAACAQTPPARIDTQACEPPWQQAQRSNQAFTGAGLTLAKDIGLASACGRGPIPIRTVLRTPGERAALLDAIGIALDGMEATPEERSALLKPRASKK